MSDQSRQHYNDDEWKKDQRSTDADHGRVLLVVCASYFVLCFVCVNALMARTQSDYTKNRVQSSKHLSSIKIEVVFQLHVDRHRAPAFHRGNELDLTSSGDRSLS